MVIYLCYLLMMDWKPQPDSKYNLEHIFQNLRAISFILKKKSNRGKALLKLMSLINTNTNIKCTYNKKRKKKKERYLASAKNRWDTRVHNVVEDFLSTENSMLVSI